MDYTQFFQNHYVKKPLHPFTKVVACTPFYFSLLAPSYVYSLPQNGSVDAGDAAISVSGDNLNIQQNSAKAIVNWSGFDIQANEAVNINQPSKQAVILNRIQGNKATEIHGQLNANGQVFLVNPNGITFSTTSQVDVGALVSSTLDIKDEDFLDGNYNFEAADSQGSILTQGSIHADTIALLGNSVVNDGWLQALLMSRACLMLL